MSRGFLTGTIASADALIESDSRRNHPRLSTENMAQNEALLALIQALASAHDCTVTRGDDIVPTPAQSVAAILREMSQLRKSPLLPLKSRAWVPLVH